MKGFTLIELLIVIGIVVILMTIAIIAINPARQFAKANNAKRWGDVTAIVDAISLRIVESKGGWPTTAAGTTPACEALPTDGTWHPLAFDNQAITTDDANVDICDCIVDEYLASMPKDPTKTTVIDCSALYDTGYEIRGTTAGRISISAPTIDDEGPGSPTEISVSR